MKSKHLLQVLYYIVLYLFPSKTKHLAGGTNAKDDILQKVTRLEDAKTSLQKEINVLNTRIAAENENCEGLTEGLKKTESTQSSLGREMRECENKLSQVQNEKADKDAQIKQMKEECQHQEELSGKFNKFSLLRTNETILIS